MADSGFGTLFGSLGQTQVSLSSGATASGDTFPALSDAVLLDLSDKGKLTSNALIVLSKPFTLADAQQLWRNDDIDDESTYILITKVAPPAIKPAVFYGDWQQSPTFPGTGFPVTPTFQQVILPQSQTWKLNTNRRGTFSIEIRARVVADTDVFPPASGISEDAGILGIIPSNGIQVSAKGSDGKRSYSATGSMLRFYNNVLNALNAGAFEWRYVLTTSKTS